jgi:CemA family
MTDEQSEDRPKEGSNGLIDKVNAYFRWSNRWFFGTPERALEQAHNAARKIKSIEDKHFNGRKVDLAAVNYSQSGLACFKNDVDKYLNLIKIKLAEFKISRIFLKDDEYIFLEKLNFIDEIVNKYQVLENREIVLSRIDREVETDEKPITIKVEPYQDNPNPYKNKNIENAPPTLKQGLLPRSIGKTFRRIQTEMDVNSEEELVQKFRNSKRNTKLAVRFLLLIVIVPLLTQQLSKQFLILPIVQQVREREKAPAFINYEMKEEAIDELKIYEEGLRFNSFLEKTPRLPETEIEEKIKEKANELNEEFKEKSNIAVSNVFADILGLISFAIVVFSNQKGIAATKAFLNTIVYDLSDSAKAFIIILFTDVFVGFHSPHGWEVILENLAEHLGLPASRDAIFIFISTFPVILDTVFKYWIFRYLNQISPSAVATLKNMNE